MAEWALFLMLLSAGGLVMLVTTVEPHRRKTAEFVARAAALEAEVLRLRADARRIEREIAALDDDPWLVERELRRRTGFLRVGEHRLGARDRERSR